MTSALSPLARRIGRASDRAIVALAAGRPVVLIDEKHDCGDLLFAAAAATTSVTSFTIRHSSGFLEVALGPSDCRRLRLPGAAADGDVSSAQRVSVDLRGPGTGISAADRAATIRALADPSRTADDFTRPGHVVPVRAQPTRWGSRTEAAAQLAAAAGLAAAAALAGLVAPDRPTEMADHDELLEFADQHDLATVTIADVLALRGPGDLVCALD
jgi:3,4-dihydroxy 2-butanone 4-phosphate synthase / GTP cyclohydrolase II